MFGELLGAARVGYANIGRDDDIRSARVATRRESGGVEVGCKDRSREYLTDTSNIVRGGRGRPKHAHRVWRCATTVEPNQRDVVLGGANAGGVGGRFGKGHTTSTIENRNR